MTKRAKQILIAFAIVLRLAPLAAPQTPDSVRSKDEHRGDRFSQLMHDPSFESLPCGLWATTGTNAAWEVQRKGRVVIRDRLVVSCVEGRTKAKSGSKCLLLSIPKETAGFEFVTVGQRLQLVVDREYEASAWVRWVNGPCAPPVGASATSAHPSAIVSFWARHRDGKGAFAGRDVWLFDNRWHKMSFRFCATDPEQRTLIYVSLLPNQKPSDTTVLLDDFELTSVNAQAEAESRLGNLVDDSSFAAQRSDRITSPWSFTQRGGKNISVELSGTDGQRRVKLQMPKGTSNFESAQLWQHLDLRRGVRYEISCRIRWDNFAADAPAPIVNYGVFHEDPPTWYGPIDQVLEKSAEWNMYRFVHIPPFGGRWKLYVQLNGWGNFGRAVAVSLDEFKCMAAQ
jgi:hypothetical protein